MLSARVYRALSRGDPYNKDIPMAQTKFGAGQRVAVVRGSAFSAPAGMYEILSVMPSEVGPPQYRVRNQAEKFERVLDEARLEAVSYE